MVYLMGIDPGAKYVGIALFDIKGEHFQGCRTLKVQHDAPVLVANDIEAMLDVAVGVVCEQFRPRFKFGFSADDTIPLRVKAYVEYLCYRNGVAFFTYDPSQVKYWNDAKLKAMGLDLSRRTPHEKDAMRLVVAHLVTTNRLPQVYAERLSNFVSRR